MMETTKGTPDLLPEQIKQLTPEELIQQFKGFLYKIIGNYAQECQRVVFADKEDLYQAAVIGLMNAQRLYDPEGCKVSFMQHAYRKILREIHKALGIQYVLEGGQYHYERVPTLASLDQPLSEDTSTTLGETIPDTGETIEEAAERTETAEVIRKTINRLPVKEREVMKAVFLDNKDGKEAAAALGITYAALNGRKHSAYTKLRRILEKRDLYNAHHIGVKEYNRTWTSEVEKEALYNEEISRGIANIFKGDLDTQG